MSAPRPSEADDLRTVLRRYLSPEAVFEVEAQIAARDAEHEREVAEAKRALADLRGEIKALIQRAESGADDWGACSHEWARIAAFRALLPRDDAAGAGGAS